MHRLSGRGTSRKEWGSARAVFEQTGWFALLPRGVIGPAGFWPPLFGEIEGGWEKRFGKDDIGQLRQALLNIANKLDVELPDGLPGGVIEEGAVTYPPRVDPARVEPVGESLPLPTLLSRLLLAFRLEFDRESPMPLVLCANTLRVLGEKPIRMADMIRLTGGSPETSDIGWQVKPFVVIAPDPAASRGKVVSLSWRGLAVQAAYEGLVREIEKRWKERFGKEPIRMLRESLEGLFERYRDDAPLLAEGSDSTSRHSARAGDQTPALGRRE